MPVQKNIRCVSAGVDWLTVTQSEPEKIKKLRTAAFAIADVELHSNMFGRPSCISGYEGFSVGGLDYGERHDGVMVRLRSEVAQSHWRRFYELASNVTRIDVQGTFRSDEDARVICIRHRRQLQAADRKRKGKPKTSYKMSREGGLTVYSGSRQSEKWLRIYNKGIEDTHPMWSNTVRYEVEVKGKSAKSLAFQLSQMKSEHFASVAFALEFTSTRGGKVKELSNVINRSATQRVAIHLPSRVTDVERTCQWLGKAVRPSVESLLTRLDSNAVLTLLGLADFARSNPS